MNVKCRRLQRASTRQRRNALYSFFINGEKVGFVERPYHSDEFRVSYRGKRVTKVSSIRLAVRAIKHRYSLEQLNQG